VELRHVSFSDDKRIVPSGPVSSFSSWHPLDEFTSHVPKGSLWCAPARNDTLALLPIITLNRAITAPILHTYEVKLEWKMLNFYVQLITIFLENYKI
jgi:hypothetical protein